MKNSKIVAVLMSVTIILSMLLGACAPAPTPTAAPAAPTAAAAPTSAPAAPTAAPAAPAAPTVAPAAPTAAPAAPAAVLPDALKALVTKDFKVVWYAPAPHPYFEDVRKGVDAFEKDFGVTVQKQIGPDWKQDSENQGMEALAAKGFTSFSVYPADAAGANGLYDELTKKGIKIVNFGSSTAKPTTASFAVATDVKAAAAAAAEKLIAAMGDKGNIINVLEVLEDPNTVLRKQGIEETVAKHPNVKIIQEVSGMKTQEEATQKVNDALAANADKVDGMIATGDISSIAVAQVLTEYKSKGGTRAIHAIGIDTDKVVLQAIKDGVIDGTIVQNPYGHAYLSLLILLAMQNGYTPKADAYFVDTGFAYATKDNLDNYYQDTIKVTQQIAGQLLTKYLAGGPAAAAPAAAPAMSADVKALAIKDFKVVWYAPAPHPYFEDVRKGVDAFEKDFGVTVQKQIGPDWKQDSENQGMEALAAKGFTSFSVYPADAAGANGLYDELTKKGIKIVNFGSSTAKPTTASFAVATDVKAAAAAAAEKLIAAMGDKGNIINVLEVLEDPNTVLRKQGIEETVAKHPNVKIIQEVSGMKTQEEATQKVNDALAANADKVDGMIATGDISSIAVAQVLTEYKSKGGTRAIHAIGIDTDKVVLQAIKDGVIDGTIVQNPYGHAYLSLLILLAMQNGYTPKADAYFVDTGFAYATKDNLDNYYQDTIKVTQQIAGQLLTKYLEKK